MKRILGWLVLSYAHNKLPIHMIYFHQIFGNHFCLEYLFRTIVFKNPATYKVRQNHCPEQCKFLIIPMFVKYEHKTGIKI